MDCHTIQERVLERFESVLTPQEKEQLDRHLSGCPECAEFAALQSQLDVRLQKEIAPPTLSPHFRADLHVRIAQERQAPWPHWLPDVAHLVGSAAAIGLCTFLLPLPVPIVLGTGALVALGAYSLQALIVSTLDSPIE
jgi:anti-sigma factor RsiW